jgi:hypothetical protein
MMNLNTSILCIGSRQVPKKKKRKKRDTTHFESWPLDFYLKKPINFHIKIFTWKKKIKKKNNMLKMIEYWYNICVHTGTQLICCRSASAKHSYLPASLTYEIPLMSRSHVAKTAACLLCFAQGYCQSEGIKEREREPNCRVTRVSLNSAPFFWPRLAAGGGRVVGR